MSINKYKISEQAINDLNDIWIYTFQKWSKEQADRYYDLIIGEIEFIADNFMIGKSAQQTRKNYRYSKIKSHLIFYRKTENGIVEIVRILHQRMDLKKRVAE
jgi:toxin ParE1/3/4